MLDQPTIAALASHIDEAQSNARTIAKLTDTHPDLSVADGYAVQAALVALWTGRGRVQAGYKLGLTSKAKMAQMGVDQPSVGALMADTARPEGSAIRFDSLVQPRVEAEIAFVTKAELSGAASIEQILAATDFVLPAIEIIGSRYEAYRFDLPSVIADNSSSQLYVTGGRPRRPHDIDLATIGIVLEKNGEPAGLTSTAAVLGHPARAVQMLLGWLAERGRTLPAGSIILSGAATEAVPVAAGDNVTARYQDMGSVSVRFE